MVQNLSAEAVNPGGMLRFVAERPFLLIERQFKKKLTNPVDPTIHVSEFGRDKLFDVEQS